MYFQSEYCSSFEVAVDGLLSKTEMKKLCAKMAQGVLYTFTLVLVLPILHFIWK